MAYPDGATVGRILGVPALHEGPGADGEAIAAVGVADPEDRSRNGFTLGYQQLERAVRIFHH